MVRKNDHTFLLDICLSRLMKNHYLKFQWHQECNEGETFDVNNTQTNTNDVEQKENRCEQNKCTHFCFIVFPLNINARIRGSSQGISVIMCSQAK